MNTLKNIEKQLKKQGLKCEVKSVKESFKHYGKPCIIRENGKIEPIN